jgi:sugar phosphate isomerase/epimerase
VDGAGRENGAVLVVAWHWSRAGSTPVDLAAVPGDRIVAVQLCDVLEHPLTPLRAESLGHRLPPGRGFGDVLGMLDALLAADIAPQVVAVEVISDDLVARGPDVAAATAYEAAREVLGKVASR